MEMNERGFNSAVDDAVEPSRCYALLNFSHQREVFLPGYRKKQVEISHEIIMLFLICRRLGRIHGGVGASAIR